MTNLDHNLRDRLREEADGILFAGIDMNEQLKQSIRRQAAAEKQGSRRRLPRTWIAGIAALAAAAIILTGYPMLQQTPGNPAIPDDGLIGSELSQLTITTLGSVAEAKAAFGADLLVPGVEPAGLMITDLTAVGMAGEPARDVIITYGSGEQSVTFSASRSPAAFPVEMFSPVQVNGEQGYVFEQSTLIELFWVQEGVQYGIVGPLSADEAMKAAQSLAR